MNQTQLTPRQIVHELDRFIVGQDEAKKAVAIALRNRYRRSRVEETLREERRRLRDDWPALSTHRSSKWKRRSSQKSVMSDVMWKALSVT